jgi:hypothetical protein
MRRRRQLLAVQTFPFLAVLLCTMGAMILLLLVIDRRAKAVARAKAEQAARQAAEAQAKADADRLAEWQRKRRQLHALLAEQENELVAQITTVRTQIAEATAKVQRESARAADLQQRLRAEEEGLERDRQEVESRRARARQQAQQRAREAAERTAKARQEAARLSAELAQMEQVLAGLKALRQKEEQTYSVVPFSGRHGQIRQPIYVECAGGAVIFHPDRLTLAGADLSPMAVRRELDRRLAARPVSHGGAPYLLLLVRPNGIESFYLLQTALAGLNLDFGYELVDQDWVLDFSGEHPQEMVSTRTANERPQLGRTAGVSRPVGKEAPTGAGPGGLTTPSQTETTMTGLPSLALQAGNRPVGKEAPTGAGPGGLTTPSQTETTMTGLPSLALRTGNNVLSGGAVASLLPPRLDGALASGPAASGPATPTTGFGESETPTSKNVPYGRGGPPGASAGAADSPPRASAADLSGGPFLASRARPRPATPLGLLLGSRDWYIAIECGADGVTVLATGQHFRVADLRPTAAMHPLVQDVCQLIDRRQASVRPGEPPWRPILRYRVEPDGLRSYYAANALLTVLRLPASRENLETDGPALPDPFRP